MAFKALFMAHAPDAEHEKHNNIIDTGKYRLFTYIVRDQQEALQVARSVHEKESIDSILLCPGFTHADVAELFAALDGKVAVCVSRGDGPSGKITGPRLGEEFFGR